MAASSLKDIKVVTPICERPAVHITCLEDLLQWVRKAQQLAASVEQQFYDTDGGPDSSDLLRELDWLLDDSLAACCQKGRDSDACAKRWKACSWRDVKACLPAWSLANESQDSTSSGIVTACIVFCACAGLVNTMNAEANVLLE
jgi:hypothetical protein